MVLELTIHGNPVTKKNSQQMVRANGRMIPIPSAQYKRFEKEAVKQLQAQAGAANIGFPVNVACAYYMPTHRKCDLVNLLEATLDVMVKAGVIADDNYSIVARHDGCAVGYDKDNPRTEITIREIMPYEDLEAD